jgi:citrate synthase
MAKRPSWLSSRDAAALLDVKLATLYAYTSRGLIESVPGPNGRGRRYARASIERLKARHDARSGHGAVAAGALRFGEPLLETSISDIRSDGPWYRGHSALELCERNVGFEAVFDLLVTGELIEPARWPVQSSPLAQLDLPVSAHAIAPSSLLAAWLSIAALSDEVRHGASDLDEHARARRLTLWLASKLDGLLPPAAGGRAGRPSERSTQRRAVRGQRTEQRSLILEANRSLQQASAGRALFSRRAGQEPRRSQRQASARGALYSGRAADAGRKRPEPRRSQRQRSAAAAVPAQAAAVAAEVLAALGGKGDPLSVELIDRTLILCADHELNASTFAARVAASTGADLYACLGAALHTLSGGRHGGASARVEALLREIGSPERVAGELRERFARGEAIPGFGQQLYPQGDPRGRVLFELAARAASSGRRRTQYECLMALTQAMQRAGHPGPNLDAGLVAVCSALGLPRGSAAALFAIGRIPGWVAHTLEQRAQHYILRPRAKYIPTPAR